MPVSKCVTVIIMALFTCDIVFTQDDLNSTEVVANETEEITDDEEDDEAVDMPLGIVDLEETTEMTTMLTTTTTAGMNKSDSTTTRANDSTTWNNETTTSTKATPKPTTPEVTTGGATSPNMVAKDMNHFCKGQRSAFVNETWYIYCALRISWKRAKSYCRFNGFHLASFRDKNNLLEVVKALKLPNATDVDLQFWVGANDEVVEGRYVWSETLTPVSTDLWSQGYPVNDHPAKDCGFVDSTGSLKNRRCFRKLNALCAVPVSEPRWFNDDSLMCHCPNDQCDEMGNCPDDRCAYGWFGPGCQFRNLDFDVENFSDVLQDYNNKTCAGGRNTLRINFPRMEYFTWMRVVLKSKGQLQGFDLFVDTFLDFDAQFIFQDPLTLDIRTSFTDKLAENVKLEWTGTKSLCTVYMYGGRNMALKQKAYFNASTAKSTSAVVDGYHWNALTCFGAWRQWEIHFAHPIHLHEIIMYRKIDNFNFSAPPRFALSVRGSEDDVNCITDDHRAYPGPYVRIPTMDEEPVKAIAIYQFHVENESNMSVCELLAFGDCAPPLYGANCEMTCSKTCLNQHCHYTGECYACETGLTGVNCTEEEFVEEEETTVPPKKANKVRTVLGKLIFVIAHGGVAMVLLTALIGYLMTERVRRRSLALSQAMAIKEHALYGHHNQESPLPEEREQPREPSYQATPAPLQPPPDDTLTSAQAKLRAIASGISSFTFTATETRTTTEHESEVDDQLLKFT